MAKVLVTGPIPEEALDLLRSTPGLEVRGPGSRPLGRARLAAAARDVEGILATFTDRVDAEVLAAPALRVVANVGVGFDNIDVEAASRRGIMVTNTPHPALVETTADTAWALILAVARRVVEGDSLVRSGRWRRLSLDLLLGRDVHGSTLGIVGVGRIGQAVARRARGFGMRILLYSRHRDPRLAEELGGLWVGLHELLERSDFVSLHVPLTPETRHMIGRRELAMMRPTAYLINTARGPVVDEEALVEALREGRIAGAGLDVYEREPRVSPGLRASAGTVLLPHLGSATTATRRAMALMAVENLRQALAGQRPANLVNPEALGGGKALRPMADASGRRDGK